MPVTGSCADAELAAAAREEIARVRDSGVLGRSGRLRELFDYLVERTDAETPPKEFEIAFEVFGKTDADAVKDDPVARVYVHRLRKRLDDFYLREPPAGGVRLVVPKGEYRLVGRRVDGEASSAAPLAATGPAAQALRLAALVRRRWRVSAAVAVLVLGNLIAWPQLAPTRGGALDDLRAGAPWAGLFEDDEPLMILVGDYYMFAEYEGGLFLDRLVREFSINSKEDLLERQRLDPNAEETYVDVSMSYLPTSAAFALAEIVPLIPDDKPFRVALASEVSPDALKEFDVVYVGLLSGLGALRGPAFSASRFSVGETYDEIVDTETGRRYLSEAFESAPLDSMYRDYGFLSTFEGPTGHRVVIVSGARDTAVMGVAESLTRPSMLRRLGQEVDAERSFEALYEVQGQQYVSLESRILAASPRDDALIWASGEAPQFPAE